VVLFLGVRRVELFWVGGGVLPLFACVVCGLCFVVVCLCCGAGAVISFGPYVGWRVRETFFGPCY